MTYVLNMWNTYVLTELVGSLQSYELDLPKTNKSKSMALKSVMMLIIMDLMMKSLLQRLPILSRTLETFVEITIEGQIVKIMLNLRTLRKMNQLKPIVMKNQKKKLANLLVIL